MIALKAVSAMFLCCCVFADEPQLKHRDALPEDGSPGYRVRQGQRIPVQVLNTLTTRGASDGDRLYLQTVFPVLVSGRIVIPVGSYIDARVTEIRRPGRVKGRAELRVRLEELTLPNGVQRPLRADLAKVGAENPTISSSEGFVKGAAKSLPLSCPSGLIATALIVRGPDVILVPGTTAEVVLQDAIVFSEQDLEQR